MKTEEIQELSSNIAILLNRYVRAFGNDPVVECNIDHFIDWCKNHKDKILEEKAKVEKAYEEHDKLIANPYPELGDEGCC